MILKSEKIHCLNAVNHEGKVIILGINRSKELLYTVRQSGYEDSVLKSETVSSGYEDWKKLNLDQSIVDESVIEMFSKKWSSFENKALLRSVYGKDESIVKSAISPIQAVSGIGHLYIFRLSLNNKLLVNRFVLDGIKNELVPKLEVRFRRSKERYRPDMGNENNETLNIRTPKQVDSLDYRDMDNKPFYEPAMELSFIENLTPEKGWFSVALLKTMEHEKYRWNIFVYDCIANGIILYTIGCSEDGLFDLKDYTLIQPAPDNPNKKIIRTIPGIIKRKIVLNSLTIENTFSAAVYNIQKERSTKAGLQMLKESTKVMLAVPVKKNGTGITKTAVISFSAANDGTLSQIDASPDSSDILLSNNKDILLPLDTLDEIKVISDDSPPPSGRIKKMELGENDLLRIYSSGGVTDLKNGNKIKVQGTKNYDGCYIAKNITDEGFEIQAEFLNSEQGSWEVMEEKNTGLLFDNMIVGYEKTNEGLLKVICTSHDLQDGDEVQVSGTANYNGLYPVKNVDEENNSFLVGINWDAGEILNLKTFKRRGIRFNDSDDFIRTSMAELNKPKHSNSISRTISGWVWVDERKNKEQLLISQEDQGIEILVDTDNKVFMKVLFNDGTHRYVKDPEEITLKKWTHYAAIVDYDTEKSGITSLSFIKNGSKVSVSPSENEITENNTKVVLPKCPQHFKSGFLDCDGSGDYVEIPAHNNPNRALTISLWAKSRSALWNNSGFLISKRNAFVLHPQDNSKLIKLYIRSGGNWRVAGFTPEIDIEQWHYYTGTFDGEKLCIFIDGKLVESMEYSGMIDNDNGILTIGKDDEFNRYFNGGIAGVSIWDRAQSEAEIRKAMHERLTGSESGLVGYWPLDDFSTRDYSMNKRHGILRGNPQWRDKTLYYPAPANKKSFVFDNDDDCVIIRNYKKFPKDKLSLCFWVKSGGSKPNPTPFSYAAENYPNAFTLENTGNLCVNSLSAGSQQTGISVNDGEWHHVAVTWDSFSGILKLYKNGKTEFIKENFNKGQNLPLDGTITLGQKQNSLGGGFNVNNTFAGSLSQVGLWEKVLTEEEITGVMLQEITGDEDKLCGSWCHGKDFAMDLSLFQNHGEFVGDPAAADQPPELSPGKYHTRFYMAGNGRDNNFTGKLSEIQVWNKAFSELEIKNTMYLQPKGNEDNLAGYWRLGGIINQDDVFITPDFSTNFADALVYGGAYVSARELSRRNNLGKAVMYENDDLFAVTQGASYRESFEFRVHRPDNIYMSLVDINNADGIGNKLFEFSYWGKKSRNSKNKIRFTNDLIQMNDFKSADGGWHKAECLFVIPEGVSLVRSFGIDKIRGLWMTGAEAPDYEWTVMEVRKHRIELVSDSITQELYTDEISLAELADDQRGLKNDLDLIASEEQKVSLFHRDLLEVLEKIDLYENVSRYQREKNSLDSELQNLSSEKSEKEGKLSRLKNDRFRFIHYIRGKESWRMLDVHKSGRSNRTNVKIYNSNGTGAQKWVFEKQSNNYYRIRNPQSGRYLDTEDPRGSKKGNLVIYDGNYITQYWKLESRGSGYYALINKDGNYALDASGSKNSANVQLYPFHGKSNQLWKLESTGVLDERIKSEIRSLESSIGSLSTLIRKKTKKRDHLAVLLEDRSNQSLDDLRNMKTELLNNISGGESQLTQKNRAYLSSLNNFSQTSKIMQLLNKDFRSLYTYGALLDFAEPLTGIKAFETCEGNVQLSYFDRKGGIKLVNYDAASDTRNSRFEEWISDSVRACINIKDYDEKISLENSIDLKPNQWSIEGWFYYPGQFKPDGTCYEYNVLASSGERDDYALAIRDGNRLGTVVNGFFHDSGYSMEENNVSHGWHHIAAVAKEGITYFYLDGNSIGNRKKEIDMPVRYSMKFNGNDDCIRIDNFPFPSGDFTIAFWVRIDSSIDEPTPFSYAGDNSKNNTAAIINLKDIKVIINDSPGSQSTGISLNDGKWHHLAVTWEKSSGALIIYVDGMERIIKLDYNTGNNTPSGGTLVFGQEQDSLGGGFQSFQAFDGELSGVSVWGTVRTPMDIQEGMYTILKGDEDNLVGYWPMNTIEINGDIKLEDKCGSNENPFHGDVIGSPEVATLDSQCSSDVSFLGNSSKGGSPFGKLSEIRIWNTALSDEEIAVNSKIIPSGNEPGLSAYYPMSEGAGLVIKDKSSIGENHCRLTTENWVGCTARVGKLENSVTSFNGQSWVSIPNHNDLNPTGSISLEAWIKPSAIPADDLGIIIQKWDDNHPTAKRQYQLAMTDDGIFECYLSNDGRNYPSITSNHNIELNKWTHVCFTYDGYKMKLYINGDFDREVYQSGNIYASDCLVEIGGYVSRGYKNRYFKGEISDVRIWNCARTAEEVKSKMTSRLNGDETGLVGYWKLDGNIEGKIKNYVSNENDGSIHKTVNLKTDDLPLAGSGVVSCEYSTIGTDPEKTNGKLAVMRRLFALSGGSGEVFVYPDQRVEELELKWIGNAQFKPTLLGYIEGPPPVPSENLTLNYDYDGAAFVQLTQSEDVTYSWMRNKDVSHGLDMNLFLGAGWGVAGGFGITSKISEGKAGFRGALNLRNQISKQSSVRASSSEVLSDRLELRGAYETNAKFSNLGSRYVPKNVGYALVVSGLADIFITKMKKSGVMVSYEILPVEGIPLDINTITFLINPAYTMNGSLDGQVGSQAADEKFYNHVPEMRSQFGSLYPASYFRLKEAYDLKSQIERWDKERESYFVNFDSTRTDDGALVDQTADASEYDSYGQVDVNREEDKNENQESPSEAEIRKEHASSAKENRGRLEDQSQQRKSEIQEKIKEQDKQIEASTGFDAWQKRMENLQIRGAKRNIVNTYVWDADGGLRSEEQNFANTVEHTIGGAFTIGGNLGGEVDLLVSGFKFELQALYAGEMTQTMNKSKMANKGFDLDVYLGGVESKGITDHEDYPVQPGEKVDRYRFMSFYLEGNTSHFDDFFNYVVDPEWLGSNDEEARALRQAQSGKPNKCWRVLHRVTYVERPALMGFGSDLRPTESLEVIADEVVNYFDKLEQDNKGLSSKLDQILLLLNNNG